MVTVAIAAILAAIALPSYRQSIIRGNRSAAESQMMDIANREQQYLLANRVYADTATLTANGYSLPVEVSRNYTWTVTPGGGTVPSFLVTFTAVGSQASDGVLTLDNQGNKTPLAKWR